MADIIKLKPRVRPLKKTYQPTAPYEVERKDLDDGSIMFFVVDMRPETYRTVAHVTDYGAHCHERLREHETAQSAEQHA